jgi:hypothetical protein
VRDDDEEPTLEQRLFSTEGAPRAALAALTPSRYLAAGYRDTKQRERPELTGLWAIAAAERLHIAGVPAASLEAALDPVAGAATSRAQQLDLARLKAGLREGLAGSRPPPAVDDLVSGCINALAEPADLAPMAHHLAAVLHLLALKGATSKT